MVVRNKFIPRKSKLLFLGAFLLNTSLPTLAQEVNFKLNNKHQIDYLHFPCQGNDTIFFNNEKFGGPSLLLNGKELLLEGKSSDLTFRGHSEELDYSISYEKQANAVFKIEVTCKNISGKELKDMQFSLQLGINTCMEKYPEWRSLYFPTLLKCEKTHFWGYFMTPNGNILAIASPQPIASYHLGYNNADYNFASGHLIRTAYLDLMNPEPLPMENPDHNNSLKNGETRSWSIYLTAVNQLEELGDTIHQLTKAPFVQSELYTVEEGNDISLEVISNRSPKLFVTPPSGKKSAVKALKDGKGKYGATFTPTQGKGVYTMEIKTKDKISHAWFSVRHDWNEYMVAARKACLDYPQKASSHTESWYGFMSAYLAKRHFPNQELDKKVEDLFTECFPLMYDPITKLPLLYKDRIQNHAMMASLFTLRYKAGGNIEDLYNASTLADYLLTKQTNDGAYRNLTVHYTSVIYIAKSIMEVMEEEKKLENDPYWKRQYERHYHSVKMAMDELVLNLDNIQTEGQNTFEDCMIASSYGQLAMFALLQPKGSAERAKYLKAATHFADSHRCLSQLIIPDSRVHGGSIRFWESQYDILTFPNFINSPHGWSAWRIYGLKYMYQLTADAKYLLDLRNAISTCVQLLNPSTGVLNWSFVSDPYVKVKYFVEDELQKGKGCHVDSIIGRQYMPMISDWYRAPKDKWVSGFWDYDGGCCDNDVHEIFKCMGELVLTCAYFHVNEDGSVITLNCDAQKENGQWIISTNSKLIDTLYTNVSNVKYGKKIQIVG